MKTLLPPRRLVVNMIALAATATGLIRKRRSQRIKNRSFQISILEYHEVSDGDEKEGVVSAERFRRHLECLQADYEFVSLSQAVQRLYEPQLLNRDAIVISFDDGCIGNHDNALPILQELSVSATVFLTTGFTDGADLWFDFVKRALTIVRQSPECLDSKSTRRLSQLLGNWPPSRALDGEMQLLKYSKPEVRATAIDILAGVQPKVSGALRPMTWRQIREFQSCGNEIGCHTVTHPILSKLNRETQEFEIQESRRRISDELGVAPDLFAYPTGSRRDYNHETIEILKSHGFKAACTTIRGANSPGCDTYELRRIGVGADSCMLLRARLNGLFDDWMRRKIS